MIKKYLIAKHLIEFDFDNDFMLEERLLEYESDLSADADFSISVVRVNSDIHVKKQNITKISGNTYFYSNDETDILFYYDEKISKVIAKIEFSKDYTKINVTLYNLNANHGVEDKLLLFNVMNTVINYAIQMHGGFVFHSSSICHEGYGVAFSAKSGTGKSTHTKLWLDCFPGTFILNDDTPLIVQGVDGRFYLCGTPWAGTTGINKNASVPLKALVFIERDTANSIQKISPSEAMRMFFEGIRRPLTNVMFSNAIDTVNKLFTQIPVYRLKCNMNPQAALVAKDEIFSHK